MIDRSPARRLGTAVDHFAPEVRQAFTRAREIVIRHHADEIDTEHLLLALLDAPEGTVAQMLSALDVDPVAVRAAVEASSPSNSGPRRRPGDDEDVPFRRRAKRAVEQAMSAARHAGLPTVGVEHLLIGLLAESGGVAARVLASLGVSAERVTAQSPARSQRFRVVIDDASDRSIFEQIVAQVQEAVATGALAGGDRLPSVRQLADELGIAPGTVARSYAELERLTLVETDGARGTRVAARPSRRPAIDRRATLAALLRPAAVAAFHLGASADDVRAALDVAMHGIY